MGLANAQQSLLRGVLRSVSFAVILPGATMDQAMIVCDRLRAAVVDAAGLVGGNRITMTVSGGVVAFDGRTVAEEVMAQADAAMYRAKLAGRNQLAFSA